MSYFIRRHGERWSLVNRAFVKRERAGVVARRATDKRIEVEEYETHGFNVVMTCEEARAHAMELNREIARAHWEKKRTLLEERMEREARGTIRYLPSALCVKFEAELRAQQHDLRRLMTLWRAMRRLVKAVEIPPEEWKRRRSVIYGYFERKHLSPDYAKKIVRMMNTWGEFYSARSGKPYSHLRCPTGFAAGRIRRS